MSGSNRLGPLRAGVRVLRWAVAVLLAVTLFILLRQVVAFEVALPQARALAVEAVGFEGDPQTMYQAGRDSLGVRLAEQASLDPSSERSDQLASEISDWQTRMGRIIRYRELAAPAARLRLYGWTAVVLVTTFLVLLLAGPRLLRRLTAA